MPPKKHTKKANSRHSKLPMTKFIKEFQPDKTPIMIVSVGSFSPPTLMHMRIMEEAKFALEINGFHVVAGYMSPVHQEYGKKALAPMKHRMSMLEAATDNSEWLMMDPWECQQPGWTPTAQVLLRYVSEMRRVDPLIQVAMVCGADLLESFTKTDAKGKLLWDLDDIETILSNVKLVVFERADSDVRKFVKDNPMLDKHANNIISVTPFVNNNISSSLVRSLLRAKCSIKYLVPDVVHDYIYANLGSDDLNCWIDESRPC